MIGQSVLSLRGAFRADLALRHCPGSGRRQGRTPARSSRLVVVHVPPCQQAKQNDDDDSPYFCTHAFLFRPCGAKALTYVTKSFHVRTQLDRNDSLSVHPRDGTWSRASPPSQVDLADIINRVMREIANQGSCLIMHVTAGITALPPSGHFISSGMTSRLEI
jgi:hypothetical protein